MPDIITDEYREALDQIYNITCGVDLQTAVACELAYLIGEVRGIARQAKAVADMIPEEDEHE